MPIDPTTLSNKAQELALDLGADSVIIIAVVPSDEHDGWESGHGAYLGDNDLTWAHVIQAVRGCAEDILTEPILDAPVPS